MATVQPKFWGTTSVVATDGDYDAVAMLPDGGYVVAWRDDKRIAFQIYNGNGDKVGGSHTTTAPTNSFGSQSLPDILTKADGSFVITWVEETGSSTDNPILKSQTFDMHGGSKGAAVQLNDGVKSARVHATTNGSGGQVTAHVKNTDNTNTIKFVVVETTDTGSTETVIPNVRVGNKDLNVANKEADIDWLGNELGYAVCIPISGNSLALGILKNGTVTTFDTLIGNTADYDVVALKNSDGTPNGRFVVTYSDLSNYQVKVETFRWDATNKVIVRDSSVDVGPRTTDSGGPNGNTKTSVTALSDGGYAVAYKGQGATASDIFVKVFDAAGAQGPAFQIPVNGQQNTPAISEMADGRLAVTWSDPSLGSGAIETVVVDARAAAVTKVTGTGDNDIYAPSVHAGDKFDGGAGFDTLTFKESTAGVAVDLVHGTGSAGDAAGDTYTSFEKVIGTNFNDTLTGGAGHVLVGGAGDDVYYVSASDTQIDESGGGNDQVYSSVSYSLSAGIEYLFATGADAIDLYGNEGNNVIAGNEAANHLTGNGGNDSLYGNGGNDLLDGGAGNDVLDGGAGNDALAGGIGDDNLNGGSGDDNLQGNDGNDALYGADGNDALDGGAGNDVLYGGAGADNLKGGLGDDVIDGQGGADTMDGGAGNDTYYIDDVNDLVQDSGAGDVDTVVVSVNYDLNRLVGIENITGVGSAAITLTGNGLNNVFVGNDGANILYGGAGNDQLNGGGGNDRIHGGLGADLLTGGTGRDIFVFDTNPKAKRNADKITDFNVKDDSIYLENKYFKVGSKGTIKKPAALSSKMFYAGAKAHDKDDRIIYDKKKGVLYYDDDGIGSHKAVVIATLKKGLKMTYKDFFVI